VKFTDPPTTSEYRDYAQVTLRTIAAGLGLNYEDLTGDYTDLPFSAARMSRLRHWARVEDWRWQTLIPQFCDPVWFWAMRAAAVMGRVKGEPPAATWTAPPPPMLDPTAEGTAYKNLVRIGARTWPEMVRELGYDPQEVLSEIKAWNAKLDEAGVVLDSDPRKTSQQGQEQPSEAAPVPPPAAPPAGRPAPAGKPAA
jgi:capsid protein